MREKSYWLILFSLLICGCVNSDAENLEESDDSQYGGLEAGNPDLDWQLPADRAPRFLFIHHSTGSGFLFEGGMWEMLEDAGFEVHNRTYGDGCVGDRTDPVHWPVTFTEHYQDMINWELAWGHFYDIVAFKSCYPASNICSDDELYEYNTWYNTVKSVVEEHPETLFIPFTTPPLVPDSTESHCAARAREFADWLTGPYIEGVGNMATYDVFDVLAEDDSESSDFNCLRQEFRKNESDSHPNAEGNRTVAANFVEWLVDLVSEN